MKNKKLLLIILVVLGLFIGMPNAKASYQIQYTDGDVIKMPGLPEVRRYRANIDGTNSMVYCLDPGRTYGGNRFRDCNIVDYIDPSTSTGTDFIFDVAATYIYKRLLEMGMTSENDANRIVGTTAYRLLVRNNATRGYTVASLKGEWDAYAYGGAIWTSSDANIKLGVQLYQEAIAVANSGKNYEQLVSEGILWAPQFEYKLVNTQNNANQIIYTYRITTTGSDRPEKFSEYASGINVSCSNSTAKCSMNVATTTLTSMDINVVVDTTSWNRQNLGLVISLPYCDVKSSTFNLVILGNSSQPEYQHMLVAFPSSHTCPSSPDYSYVPRKQIEVDSGNKDTCECHYDANGAWDGYVIVEDAWTVTSNYTSFTGWTSWGSSYQKAKFVEKGKLNETDRNNFNCPVCPDKTIPKGHTCEKSSESSTGYFCRESAPGKNDGKECTLDKYLKDPSEDPEGCGDKVRSCEKVGSTNYCKDGTVCSDDDYYSDCLCGQYEDFCTQNPEDPQCDEYYDKCINCSPVVTVPSDCTDLLDYNVNIYAGNYSGGISDISKKGSECNRNKANMVKSCVIGKKDAQNQSYEDTTIDATKNNPYCKVWCEESYDFGLPVAKHTQSGGYFTLSTNITGTRTCYTSSADDSTKPIDEQKFKADLEAARKAIIDAYNIYSYYVGATAQEAISDQRTEVANGGNNCTGFTNPGCQDPSRCNPVVPPSGYYDIEPASTTYTYYSESWTFQIYDVNNPNNQTPSTVSSYTALDGKVYSGSYSSGSASCSCHQDGTTSCSKTDGTDPDPGQESSKAAALARLNQRIQEFNNIIAQYNSCSGNMAGHNGWVNEIQFNPEITFSYNENYLNNNENAGKFVQTDLLNDTTTSTYCTTDTGRTYNCLDASQEFKVSGNNVPASAQTTETYFGCDENGCGTKSYTVSTAKWVKKERKVEATYEPRTNFSTYTLYGTIQKDVTTGKFTLYTPLPDNAYPISLMTKSGVFPFTIKFNNIGRSNSDANKLGRLIGESYGGDILTAFNGLSSADKCDVNGKKDSSFKSATTQAGYVCHYINNCDECKIQCEGDECAFDDGCYGECTYKCDNCLFDGNSLNYTFRTVSLNNLFPTNRQKGYNWDSSLKASVTKNAIESDGESILKNAQYSYTLTPQEMAKIRDYNKAAGSYSNSDIPSYNDIPSEYRGEDAIYCEEYDGTGGNGELYNVRCRSKFLDILDTLEGSGKAMASNITRTTRDSNAWELFEGYCTYGFGKEGPNGEDSCVHIGPSWRIRSVD